MAENKDNNKQHNVVFMLAETDNDGEYQYYYKDINALYTAFNSIKELIEAENAENKAESVGNTNESV